MRVAVLADAKEIARVGADMFTVALQRNPSAVLGLATGSSPIPVYDELISRYRSGEISFKDASAFLLDEYYGLPSDHPETYWNTIRNVFTGHVDFRDGAVHGPNGTADDPFQAAKDYQSLIDNSEPVEVQLLGIGTDGHIAFNEPGGSLSSQCHPQVLFEQTRMDNARFFGGDLNQVPKMALTQGLSTIMRAKKLVLVAQGRQKAGAIAKMVEGNISASCPASVLQFHDDATVLLDHDAASQLELAEQYDNAWKLEQEHYGQNQW